MATYSFNDVSENRIFSLKVRIENAVTFYADKAGVINTYQNSHTMVNFDLLDRDMILTS